MDAAVKSLNVDGMVDYEVIEKRKVILTEEGEGYATNGSPECQYVNALKMGEETLKTDVEKALGAQIAKVGFQNAMKQKWIQLCGAKKEKVKRQADKVTDDAKNLLLKFKKDDNVGSYDEKVIKDLTKRK